MSKSQASANKDDEPFLEELSSEACRQFFREFSTLRIKEKKRKVKEGTQETQMADAVAGGILQMMLTLTARVFEVVEELPEGAAGQRVRVELQAPLTPQVTKTPQKTPQPSLGSTESRAASSGVRLNFDETATKAVRFAKEETKEEGARNGPPQYLYLSDAHIEAMILRLVGPRSVDASTAFMKKIRMPDEDFFGDFAAAGAYIQEWNEALQWCSAYLPHKKTLIKNFLGGVHPQALADILAEREYDDLESCMLGFMALYDEGVGSTEFLRSAGGESRLAGKEQRKTSKGSPAPVVPAVGKTSEKAPLAASVSSAKEKEATDWTASATCYRCGAYGHISTACSLPRKPAMAAEPTVKRLGTISIKTDGAAETSSGPYLPAEVTATTAGGGVGVSMVALCDTQADVDCVGANWLARLVECGGQVQQLRQPVRVVWFDPKVWRETSTQVLVTVTLDDGTKFNVNLFVVPWDTAELVLGWPVIQRFRLLAKLGSLCERGAE